MAMQRHLCWEPSEVYKVLNTEADSMAHSVFWAVDTDGAVLCKSGEAGSSEEVSTDALLTRFLDSGRDHVQLAILGPSGSGKSHLIRRLEHRLRATSGFRIVVVQRLETSLRSILKKLIATLPYEAQKPYLEELEQSTGKLATPLSQRNALLDGLAQAIAADHVRSDSGIDRDEEDWLLSSLPSLFYDPYLRKEKFLLDGEVVADLTGRLFANAEGKRLEDLVQFERSNLPTTGVDIMRAAAPTREIITYCLHDDSVSIPRVLQIINRNLNTAIARALNFSGDRLIEILGELRAHLKKEDIELVLLFEEFARTQGYDAALLEALLEHGDEQHCNIRWAIACTSGHFNKFPDTVRTRMDLIVDFDDQPQKMDLTDFSGRYLNAARLGAERIEDAFASDTLSAVTNVCDTCEKKKECHAAFGTNQDGFGLYPFTEAALRSMTGRLDTSFRGQGRENGFNPRQVQRNVLREVVADEARFILAGAFPTKSLLQRFGGASMSASQQGTILDVAGDDADRYLAFFELYGAGGEVRPNDGVFDAFGLDAGLLALFAGDEADGRPGGGQAADPYPGSAQPAQLKASKQTDARTKELSEWAVDGFLSQNLAQQLRVAIYKHVEASIDWDMLGLRSGYLAKATGPSFPFRQLSIKFLRQTTQGGLGSAAVEVELPIRRDHRSFLQTAVALSDLLELESGKSLSVAKLAGVRELVDEISKNVVIQLQALSQPSITWDPVAGAVELLVLGAGLAGKLNDRPNDLDLVNAALEDLPPESPAATSSMKRIYQKLLDERNNLQTLVRSHISGTKGGALGRLIDARQILDAAKKLRRSKWELKQEPDDRSEPYGKVSRLYTEIAASLDSALTEEASFRTDWLDRVEQAFGKETNRKNIADTATAAIEAIRDAGIDAKTKPLAEALMVFRQVQFSNAVTSAGTIRDADHPQHVLPSFGKGHQNAMEASMKLIDAWAPVIEAATIDIRLRNEQGGLSAIDAEIGRFDVVLSQITADLEGL